MNEYFQQLWYRIAIFMTIQIWGFTIELHSKWNSRKPERVHDIYLQGFQRKIGTNITDNYDGKFVSALLISYNEFIIELHLEWNVSFYIWVYILSINSVWSQVNGMHINDKYVSIFPYYSYFNSWWFKVAFYLKFHVRLSHPTSWFIKKTIEWTLPPVVSHIGLFLTIKVQGFTLEL